LLRLHAAGIYIHSFALIVCFLNFCRNSSLRFRPAWGSSRFGFHTLLQARQL
jgi:hypothetical protein